MSKLTEVLEQLDEATSMKDLDKIRRYCMRSYPLSKLFCEKQDLIRRGPNVQQARRRARRDKLEALDLN